MNYGVRNRVTTTVVKPNLSQLSVDVRTREYRPFAWMLLRIAQHPVNHIDELLLHRRATTKMAERMNSR
jgi:hypothetical protein